MRASTFFGSSSTAFSNAARDFFANPGAETKLERSAFSPYARPSQSWYVLLCGSRSAARSQLEMPRSHSSIMKYARQSRLNEDASLGDCERCCSRSGTAISTCPRMRSCKGERDADRATVNETQNKSPKVVYRFIVAINLEWLLIRC